MVGFQINSNNIVVGLQCCAQLLRSVYYFSFAGSSDAASGHYSDLVCWHMQPGTSSINGNISIQIFG